MKDADGIPWEMYTLLEDVEADTAADLELRRFLGQEAERSGTQDADVSSAPTCRVPAEV